MHNSKSWDIIDWACFWFYTSFIYLTARNFTVRNGNLSQWFFFSDVLTAGILSIRYFLCSFCPSDTLLKRFLYKDFSLSDFLPSGYSIVRLVAKIIVVFLLVCRTVATELFTVRLSAVKLFENRWLLRTLFMTDFLSPDFYVGFFCQTFE